MKLKLFIGGLLASMTFGICSSNAQSSQHDGLYMGVEGSYGKIKHNDTEIIVPEFEGLIDTPLPAIGFRDPMYTDEGASSGVILGYRLSEGIFTLAAEAAYNYNHISNNSFDITNEYGGSLLPGFWVNDQIVAFGQIGFSQLQMNNAGVFNNSDTGFIFGGGIQVYMNENLSIRANYSRSTHTHKVFYSVTPYIDRIEILDTIPVTTITIRENQDSVIFQYNNSIKRDKLAISLIYNF